MSELDQPAEDVSGDAEALFRLVEAEYAVSFGRSMPWLGGLCVFMSAVYFTTGIVEPRGPVALLHLALGAVVVPLGLGTRRGRIPGRVAGSATGVLAAAYAGLLGWLVSPSLALAYSLLAMTGTSGFLLRPMDAGIASALIAALHVAAAHGRRNLEPFELALLGVVSVFAVVITSSRYRLLLAAARRTVEAERARAVAEQRARELVEARDAAMIAARTRQEFLATMSHELRTPMNGVLGMSTLLGQSRLDEPQRRMVDQVVASSEHLLGIINDILDLSKFESGHVELDVTSVDLDAIVEDVVDEFAHRARERRIGLHIDLDPRAPTHVRADALRLRQILTNLVGNALKFTATGQVDVRVAAIDAAHGTVRVEVRDTGIGIPDHVRAHLFLPFRQGDGRASRRFGGTGLGLSISQTLARAMGTVVEVESREGEGSRFWLDLPARPDVPTGAPNPLVDLRALLVSTDAPTATALASQAARLGWPLRTTASVDESEAAVAEALRQGAPFRVLLVDARCDLAASTVARVRAAAPGHELVVLAVEPPVGPADEPLVPAYASHGVLLPIGPRRLGNLVRAAAGLAMPARDSIDSVDAPEGPVSTERVVLVVDDNDTNRIVAVGYLESLGYAAESVGSAKAALARLDALGRPVLAVLMDVEMPEMDGLEATRRIRDLERGRPEPRLPVIAVTAHALVEHELAARAAGVDDYLRKPLRLADLRRALRRALGRASSSSVDSSGEMDASGVEGLLDPTTVASLRMLNSPRRPRFVRDLVASFDQTAKTATDALYAAIAEADTERVRRAAHLLKGACRNVGATELGDVLESMESEPDRTSLEANFLVVTHAVPRVRRALELLVLEVEATTRSGGPHGAG